MHPKGEVVALEWKEEDKGQTNSIQKVEGQGWGRKVGQKEREFYLCSQAD